MSRIDKLIAEYCPEGVEFKKLGEVVNLLRGRRLVKSQLEESGDFAVYQNSLIPLGYYNESNVKGDTTFVICAGAAGEIGYSEVDFWAADDVHFLVTPNHVESKFLYHFLLTQQHKIAGKVRRASIPRLSKTVLDKLPVPVPPIEVQREIVKVLDTFIKLEAELEAELEARRLQYQYYRDALLAFGDQEVRWTTMAEVGEFFRGRRFTKNDLDADGLACIHYGDIYTQYGTATTATASHVRSDMASTLRFAKHGDLVIAGVGETVEDVGKAVAWLGDGEVAIHDDCFAFRHSLNPKFVSYYFQTAAFHAEKNKFVARAKVKRLSAANLGKLAIPVPSPDEQERIVIILDKFDALTNDLSSGLPAEIAGRRKQYEHYRDRLLTFREAA